MESWTAAEVARAAGAKLLSGDGAGPGPVRVTIDSRQAGPGTLFIGLPGQRVHGGDFASEALRAGAWGVLTDPPHAQLAGAGPQASPGTVIAAPDVLRSLQRLARSWRRHLGVRVIGVTGSTGKTSTKDLLLAVLSPHRRAFASRANFNTEVGLPLEILAAPEGTEVLVLEMGMRGPGQIAELVAIAEPDVGVIVSLGPVHLELLGSLENIAAAKAELIRDLPPGATAILPAREPLLAPHLRQDLQTVTFGPGGDVQLVAEAAGRVEVSVEGRVLSLEVNFAQAHLRRNLLAAVAGARAVGVEPAGRVELVLSAGRGQQRVLPGGVTLVEDCYNANPMSMRAALDELAASARRERASRRVAVLGDMLELGPDAARFHEEVGAYASGRADVLVTVGPLAAAMAGRFDGIHHEAPDSAAAAALLSGLLRDGDLVLLKASNGVGLSAVAEALVEGAPA